MSEQKNDHVDLVTELDVASRYEVARDWAAAARYVAEQSENPKAQEIWEFIDERTTIGVPMPGGSIHYFFREKPDRPLTDYAYLTPLVAQDVDRLPADDFRHRMAEGSYNNAAEYREGSQAIYLPPAKLGRKGKGVLLLHEAMHAMLDINKMVDRSVAHAHWIEEAKVYVFEFALLSSLIGQPYDDLVDTISSSIKAESGNPNHLKVSHKYSAAERKAITERMEVANDTETGLWLSVIQLHGFWEYFKHENTTYDPGTEFAKMLRGVYGTAENKDR